MIRSAGASGGCVMTYREPPESSSAWARLSLTKVESGWGRSRLIPTHSRALSTTLRSTKFGMSARAVRLRAGRTMSLVARVRDAD
jgi:hypothetical protein